jgi:uncharacterized membrane protein
MASVTVLHWLRPWTAPMRLGVSAGIGIALYLLLSRFWPAPLAGVLAWDGFILAFLLLTYRVIADRSIDSMRRRAAELDAGTSVIMVLVIAAAFASLYGISSNLNVLPGHPLSRVLLTALTVLGSWSLIHTVYAVHYAHLYYSPPEGGLIFPGSGEPHYVDFLYYSFVVGMTCQVSDVQVSETGLRRLTLIHGVLSFFFNTVILVLAVNIGASLLPASS